MHQQHRPPKASGETGGGPGWSPGAPHRSKNANRQILEGGMSRKPCRRVWITRPLVTIKGALPPEEWSALRWEVEGRELCQ